MAISSEWAGPPVEWAGLQVSPTLPYLRVSKLCFMRTGHVCDQPPHACTGSACDRPPHACTDRA